ncbi:Protein of unknown function [Bacillus mycoides]|nr:Protein of unknown function [Bacillus mycoides]
MDFILE